GSSQCSAATHTTDKTKLQLQDTSVELRKRARVPRTPATPRTVTAILRCRRDRIPGAAPKQAFDPSAPQEPVLQRPRDQNHTRNLPAASVRSAIVEPRSKHNSGQGGHRPWIRSDAAFSQRAPQLRRLPQCLKYLPSKVTKEELSSFTKKATSASATRRSAP